MYFEVYCFRDWDKKKKSSVASCGEALFFLLVLSGCPDPFEGWKRCINDCIYECCPLYDFVWVVTVATTNIYAGWLSFFVYVLILNGGKCMHFNWKHKLSLEKKLCSGSIFKIRFVGCLVLRRPNEHDIGLETCLYEPLHICQKKTGWESWTSLLFLW